MTKFARHALAVLRQSRADSHHQAGLIRLRERPGFVGGAFLVGYGIARSSMEFFREPDANLGFLWDFITMGQLLSLPMIVVGLWLMWRAKPVTRPPAAAPGDA